LRLVAAVGGPTGAESVIGLMFVMLPGVVFVTVAELWKVVVVELVITPLESGRPAGLPMELPSAP